MTLTAPDPASASLTEIALPAVSENVMPVSSVPLCAPGAVFLIASFVLLTSTLAVRLVDEACPSLTVTVMLRSAVFGVCDALSYFTREIRVS
ncbi:MAG: hypothetical protein AVDCRST_MAG85-3421 [uncultured Solirubrobacteraceae bacterium]|uniref:Uncharacterized protein n=1 Tax=uncultured Solirubrobacteraceae bacterium TaxID=1162706 RepID=A0A6J4TNJ4_9ACTN|nr:MAG: hypothetical protein AVDCRST_MAG85-3421 [uncultured Solirubrobacteraceae bacterium]